MFNKIIKLSLIILMGATFLGFYPFVVYASSPDVSTGSVVNITSNSVTLNGSVDFNNLPTNIWFEYGTNKSLNNSLPVNAYRTNPGYSSNMIANVSGLNPNTTYYFRAVAQNSDGRDRGNIRSFTTNSNYYNYPYSYPYNYNGVNYVNNNVNYYQSFSIITEPASFVGNTSAQLNSLVYNDVNSYSNTWFEWGTTMNLSSRTSSVSSGNSPSVKHINTMTGLSPGTTYYFRAVAQNSFSRTDGSVLSFTTSGIKPSIYTDTPVITYIDVVTETKTPTTTVEKTDTVQPPLGASAITANSFFPISILGWLLLTILILVLILVSKNLYRNFLDQNKIDHTQEHS